MWQRTYKLFGYLIVSSLIIFILVEQTAGNPAILYLQRHGYTQMTQQQIDMAQHHLGLGRHILLRYLDWLGHALIGDLGYSFSTQEPVMNLIANALKPTWILMSWATVLMLPLGVGLGYCVGMLPHARIAQSLRYISQVITSMPEYWIAIVAIYYMGVKWQLLPFVGSASWQNYLLPVGIMIIVEGSHLLLMTAHLIAQTRQDDTYQLIKLRQATWKARIYCQFKVIFAPLMTIVVNSIIHLFSRAVILEVIFSMSGLGKLLITAINQRDYPLIQGIIMLIIVVIMLLNYLGDILILKSDPRIQRLRANKSKVRGAR
ncbi:ABC transporter permease [Staphylococcus lugdunensis]|jgi:peptide/nickel transport system permease protein|uniref:ABC transporter permease n=1 Tax=Staphylococcus lugdunensis TaxID=28035 RepID=A0A292DIH1_STALU|nr:MULTISPECIES: ABC transporter permease [Staphylococcus]ADC86348.1 Dipeptide transport system permease protein DppB [Staphylococcus lugdunensis HKU09-01]AMG61818.1 peptide ABC transporter permease [Staphylococcus lugdunensis]AMG64249.1 ABC transporter permease [Staphylococcus lugdunensis]ARB78907.1 ABC transporter permease [Staphylococcus lugdunensis]ARJ08099.1 peptide ABC transporter permease [Staphylococcus lugdunensis]